MDFGEEMLTVHYANLLGDKVKNVKYEDMDVVYRIYIRKPSKDHILLRINNGKGMLGGFSKNAQWHFEEIIEEFSRHPEVRIIRVSTM
ncbi:MAG: hypothetical protein NC115_10945 [Bacteroidales bacterium]|nr:hypothetical protein [Bacteroidales bacterium]